MSEYQYYEFRAVDRPLAQKQIEKLRRYSSRAEITRNSFINVYNYGDFGGDPEKLIENSFDVFGSKARPGEVPSLCFYRYFIFAIHR